MGISSKAITAVSYASTPFPLCERTLKKTLLCMKYYVRYMKPQFVRVFLKAEISDHDAVYATINIKVTRFQTRHKFIRNLKSFDESSFVDDFKTLPFAASFGVSDPDEKLEILSSLIKGGIDRHAPLKLTKVTRPPAPWLKDPAIAELKQQRDRLRSAARAKNNNKETWEKFRAVRNRLKELIKSTKRNFMERMLSRKKSKEVRKVIHHILHPSPQ
ncbi:hypothetical protein P5673_023248 [Acropora cervicornis]|uniref:Uncharacterized protein n=1 Tax=Acropora cervicornis TaxID=6130 RepID=A0AAD9Q646_ACRCE|nr:hypothetical protein P5673_023248 [Acropora cervicornis]